MPMNKIIVVSYLKDFDIPIEGVSIVSAKEYLTDPQYTELKQAQVFNLCRYYRYQSSGYYVSLLAEARGHKALPSVTTIQDFKFSAIFKSLSDELNDQIQSKLARVKSSEFILSSYFGRNVLPSYDGLCRSFSSLFDAPMLRMRFAFEKYWRLENIWAISFKDISEQHKPYVAEFARAFFEKRGVTGSRRQRHTYGLAILVAPDESAPPSDERALKRFERAARSNGMVPERITKDDLSELSSFDALFIRATTAVNNFTYRFSRKASAAGLAVIDDPISIVRCTNKVYLAELLSRYRIPIPKTLIVHKDNAASIEAELGFPCVLKQPDSSFSQGVIKADDPEELSLALKNFFTGSDFVVAQQFMPTDFDWRIGIINGRPLFACKYYMARGHWQIYNWNAREQQQGGKWETMPVEAAPARAVNLALRASKYIGNGFYGVDIKQVGPEFYVIEVNDNPSVESGVEDRFLKGQLYDEIIKELLHQIRLKKIQEVV